MSTEDREEPAVDEGLFTLDNQESIQIWAKKQEDSSWSVELKCTRFKIYTTVCTYDELMEHLKNPDEYIKSIYHPEED